METAEIRFLIAIAGYRMMDHKRNGVITEGLGITNINTVIKELPK
jgi:hypothetical protein